MNKTRQADLEFDTQFKAAAKQKKRDAKAQKHASIKAAKSLPDEQKHASIKAAIAKEKQIKRDANFSKFHPVMADVFDFFEEDRALPNSRSPFIDEIKVEHDVVYTTVDNQALLCDIYFPSRPVAERAPVVLDIPGGGWMIHNRLRRDGYARLYAVLGAAVVVIDHRLTPKVLFPENLKDVVAAVNFIVDNADKYSFDADKLTITGDSSGGHLAACLGCAATDETYRTKLGLPEIKAKPKYNVMISGAFDMNVMYHIPFTNLLIVRYLTGKNSRKGSRNSEFFKELNPYNYINKNFPETFNNGGATDPLCKGEAKRFAGILTAAGVKNDYCVGKVWWQSAHCYVLRTPFAPARNDTKTIMRWYATKMSECGVDMSDNLKRLETFLDNYKAALSGKVEC